MSLLFLLQNLDLPHNEIKTMVDVEKIHSICVCGTDDLVDNNIHRQLKLCKDGKEQDSAKINLLSY